MHLQLLVSGAPHLSINVFLATVAAAFFYGSPCLVFPAPEYPATKSASRSKANRLGWHAPRPRGVHPHSRNGAHGWTDWTVPISLCSAAPPLHSNSCSARGEIGPGGHRGQSSPWSAAPPLLSVACIVLAAAALFGAAILAVCALGGRRRAGPPVPPPLRRSPRRAPHQRARHRRPGAGATASGWVRRFRRTAGVGRTAVVVLVLALGGGERMVVEAAALTDTTFKEASWDWVQNLPADNTAAITKWGNIGDWDVSGVKDFSWAFSMNRDATGGKEVDSSNPKVATFVGAALSKWTTTSVISLDGIFKGAGAMNADLGGWNVATVTTMRSTFFDAAEFTGKGLSSWKTALSSEPYVTKFFKTFYGATKMNVDLSGWDVSHVPFEIDMPTMFHGTDSLSSCNRRRILDKWNYYPDSPGVKSDVLTYPSDFWSDATCTMTEPQFKEASWDWVQNLPDTTAATTKWGDIGDWDVSGVKDFSFAFSQHRNEVGGTVMDTGNPQAAKFVGTAISKWNTASAATLFSTFRDAGEMNADLSGWKVGKVATLEKTFESASKFTGTGVDTWDVVKVATFTFTFSSTTSLTTCNKRKIADAWKNSAAFDSTSYGTEWADDKCLPDPLTDTTFKAATWDWVQSLPNENPTVLVKWGPIQDWDVSTVKDFSHAFSTYRNEAGNRQRGSMVPNPKAALFNSDLSKWQTKEVITMERTFFKAVQMNADLSQWKVAKVENLKETFQGASGFTGFGISDWSVASVLSDSMTNTFAPPVALTDCTKRKIYNVWTSNAAWKSPLSSWGSSKCITQCPAGSGFTPEIVAWPSSTDAKCEMCPSGSYSAETDKNVCMTHSVPSCSAGSPVISGTPTSDATCKGDCATGTFRDSGTCQTHTVSKCPPGSGYTPGNAVDDSTCTVCLAGTYSKDDDTSPCRVHSISPCDPGNGYVGGSSSSDAACSPCSTGTYATGGLASAACKDCPLGRFTAEAGQAVCTAQTCAAGEYIADQTKARTTDGTDCIGCVAGMFRAGSAQATLADKQVTTVGTLACTTHSKCDSECGGPCSKTADECGRTAVPEDPVDPIDPTEAAPSPSADKRVPSPAPSSMSPAPATPGACSLGVSTWDAEHRHFVFSAGQFTVADAGSFSNRLEGDAMRALNVPRGCVAIVFNNSMFKGANCTLPGPGYYDSYYDSPTNTKCLNNVGVSSVQILNDPTYGQTANVTERGVVDGVVDGAAPARPTPDEVPTLVPAACWADFLLESGAFADTGGIRGGQTGVGNRTFDSATDAVIANRVGPLLSARVGAVTYGRRGNNPGAFWPLDGLFLAVGRGGEQATVVVSDSPQCAKFASEAVTVTVTVGGIDAPIRNRSADGLRLIVELPSYDDVCSSGGCGVSQAIRVKGTQRMKYAPPSAWWAVNQVVSWACPPLCPTGSRARATTNESSQLHPANTAALRKSVGGITYVQSCSNTSSASSSSAPPPSPFSSVLSPSSSPAPAPLASPAVVGQGPALTPAAAADDKNKDPSGARCAKAMDGMIPFVTDPRSCLDPTQARVAPCAYGGGGSCQCCPANARCPGGARTWPKRGFWVRNETSTFAEMCEPPQMKRCLGMVHGSMSDRQCGAGYRGSRCGKCAKAYYSNPITGGCQACSLFNASAFYNGTVQTGPDLEIIAPLLWLVLALALSFFVVFALVFFIQRRQGGSLTGGLSRAVDFFCYLIILLQTTLYVANDSVKSTSDVVLDRFNGTDAGEFVKSFFEHVSVLQLDFSLTVKLPCLGGDPLAFEKAYAGLTCFLVVMYIVAILVLPRLAVVQRSLLAKARRGGKGHLLYQEFTYKIATWLVLTHAVSCRIALSNMYCADEGGEGDSPYGGDDDASCLMMARDPAWWILFLVHGIGFPLATLLGAIFARRRLLGGTCCSDTKSTTDNQLSDTRATGEVGLWRYYLDQDFKATFHWFREVNMLVVMIVVCSETSIQPKLRSTPQQRGRVDLSRTCIQATAVTLYLILLCAMKPFVASKLRHWKQWVTASNQGSTLLLILTRLLAEQARVTSGSSAGEASALVGAFNSTYGAPTQASEIPAIFTAGLVFMYISTGACILQFVVLAVSFLFSLFIGAKVEEVVIVEETRKKVLAVAAEKAEVDRRAQGGLQTQDNNVEDNDDHGIELAMVENPLSRRSQCMQSVDLSGESRCIQSIDFSGDGSIDYSTSFMFAKKPVSARTSTRRSTGSGARVAPKAEVVEEKQLGSEEEEAAEAENVLSELGELARIEAEAEAEKEARQAKEVAESAAAKALADEWEAHAVAEAAAKAEAEEWEAYAAGEASKAAAQTLAEEEAKAAAEAEAVAEAAALATAEAYDRDQVQDDSKYAEEDEWTVHLDADTGFYYRRNNRTEERVWCDVDEEDADAEAEEAEEVEEVDVVVVEAPTPEDDSLATARSRLRSVMASVEGNDATNDERGDLANMISDTRGDWVEVCDMDGSVLGASLAGRTVYYNRKTYETRLAKPSGWVRMQAQEVNKRKSKRLTVFERPKGASFIF